MGLPISDVQQSARALPNDLPSGHNDAARLRIRRAQVDRLSAGARNRLFTTVTSPRGTRRGLTVHRLLAGPREPLQLFVAPLVCLLICGPGHRDRLGEGR